jgi:hypothetical protein
MANTTTSLGNRAIRCMGRGTVKRSVVAIDTTDSAVEVVASDAEEMIALVGANSSKATADTVLTFYQDATAIGVIFVASGACVDKGIMNRIISGICTQKGKALKVAASVAITLYLDTVQAESFEAGLPSGQGSV